MVHDFYKCKEVCTTFIPLQKSLFYGGRSILNIKKTFQGKLNNWKRTYLAFLLDVKVSGSNRLSFQGSGFFLFDYSLLLHKTTKDFFVYSFFFSFLFLKRYKRTKGKVKMEIIITIIVILITIMMVISYRINKLIQHNKKEVIAPNPPPPPAPPLPRSFLLLFPFFFVFC